MQALRAEHAAHVSQLRAEYEARARELTADYDRRTEVLVAGHTDGSICCYTVDAYAHVQEV